MPTDPRSNSTPFLVLVATPAGDRWLSDPVHRATGGAHQNVPSFVRSDGLLSLTYAILDDAADRHESIPDAEPGVEVALGVRAYRAAVAPVPDAGKGESWTYPDSAFVPVPCGYPLDAAYRRPEAPPAKEVKVSTSGGLGSMEHLILKARTARGPLARRKVLASVFAIGQLVAGGEITDGLAREVIGGLADEMLADKATYLATYDEGKLHPEKLTSAQREKYQVEAWKRGDEQELGEDLARRLVGPVKGAPEGVYARSAFWTWDRSTGGWIEHTGEKIRNLAGLYAGTSRKTGEDKVAPITISSAQRVGIAKVAQDLLADPAFFETAPAGLALPDPNQRAHEAGGLFLPFGPGGFGTPTYLLAEHRVMASNILPIAYDKYAKCPRFVAFLGEVFAGLPMEEVEARVAVILEFFAACLLGTATRYQQALVLVGSGSNGKSTLLNTLAELFPTSARTSVAMQSWGEDYKRAMLATAKINVCNELPARDVLDAESVKAMISGDAVTARSPYKPAFTFCPRAGHVFAANKLPPVSDLSDGFFRRFILVDFPNKFEGTAKDLDLPAALRAELPGILGLVLHYGEKLVERGAYTRLPSSEQVIREWRLHNDSVAQWLIEQTGPAGTEWTGGSAAYTAYASWAKKYGFKPVSLKEFKPRMVDQGVRTKTPGGVRQWAISLLPDNDIAAVGDLGVH